MINNILHCGYCGKPLNINKSRLETLLTNAKPKIILDEKGNIDIFRSHITPTYTYVVLLCFCQYDEKIIHKFYLKAEEWYELIKII